MKRLRKTHPTVRDLGEFGLIRELRGIVGSSGKFGRGWDWR